MIALPWAIGLVERRSSDRGVWRAACIARPHDACVPTAVAPLMVIACGGAVEPQVSPAPEASNAAASCGGARAELRSTGFTMHVYSAASGGEPPSRPLDGGGGGECPTDGRLASSSSVELVPGGYFACFDQTGICMCLQVELTGGAAQWTWGIRGRSTSSR